MKVAVAISRPRAREPKPGVNVFPLVGLALVLASAGFVCGGLYYLLAY